jgi:hypothetical protein
MITSLLWAAVIIYIWRMSMKHSTPPAAVLAVWLLALEGTATSGWDEIYCFVFGMYTTLLVLEAEHHHRITRSNRRGTPRKPKDRTPQ